MLYAAVLDYIGKAETDYAGTPLGLSFNRAHERRRVYARRHDVPLPAVVLARAATGRHHQNRHHLAD